MTPTSPSSALEKNIGLYIGEAKSYFNNCYKLGLWSGVQLLQVCGLVTTVTGLWSGVQLLQVCGLAYNCYGVVV